VEIMLGEQAIAPWLEKRGNGKGRMNCLKRQDLSLA
jgi:hypothetical protein